MHLKDRRKIVILLLLWRLSAVFVVQTAHVPDEYWQSLEVAHRMVFGYGYLTWEWTSRIRSSLYPFLVSLLYYVLTIFNLDYPSILITAPRVVQAFITTYGDYKFYEWTGSKRMLFALCINWYWYYCSTRTLINSVEMSLTIVALSMFPWRDSKVTSTKFLWIVGFLTMARPTAAIIWIPLCFYHLCTSLQNKMTLIYKYCLIAAICFLFSVLLDSYYYETFTISSWNFFQMNVLNKVGETYGKQHILWYIFGGFPVLLGAHYLFFLIGAYKTIKHSKRFHRQAVMLIVVAWTVGIYSLLAHKEFRFLLPLLPMLIVISESWYTLFNKLRNNLTRKAFVLLLITSNAFPGLYFSLVHQRGSLDVMEVLRDELENRNTNTTSVLFLTPCHATPLYSHLHMNVSTRILTCLPNLRQLENYKDEADEFFENPVQWLDRNYPRNERNLKPNYIVVFDNISFKIQSFLADFQMKAKTFYSHFPQTNYGKFILVYEHVKEINNN